MKSYLLLTLALSLFTFITTALGALCSFLVTKKSKNIFSLMYGIASGIMLAASFFSLILPSISLCESLKQNKALVLSLSMLSGAFIIYFFDFLFKKQKKLKDPNSLLIFAITLHNIPEGLAIGVSVGALFLGIDGTTLSEAILLGIGIGIQNFPEGAAVSMPLSTSLKKRKAFMIGALSGAVEPISALLGFLLVSLIRPALPFVLGLASGAMIYVVIDELIPQSKLENSKIGLMGAIFGFVVMMFLDLFLS